MKIKTKKQLNLPQLIEYAWDNDMRNKNFESEGGAIVYFDYDGNLTCARGFVPQDFFTVTTEEEITEETHLDYLYALTNDDEKEIHRCMNFTIRNASMVIGRNDLTFFTLIDNDLVKIYENGKLVD